MKNTLILLSFVSFLLCSCKSDKANLSPTEKDYCSEIHHTKNTSLTSELLDIEDQLKNKSGVCVLENGGASMITRAWLCTYAEKTIDIQYFIFSTDNIGLIAIDYLVRAADRGVQVRILIDDIMVDANIKDVLTLAAHQNIRIRIYNPGVNLGKSFVSKLKKFATEFRLANQRMHNKTFIVDEKVVITGGRNIADEYFDFDHTYNFRDRDVLLLGDVCADVDASFEEFWKSDLSVDVNSLVSKEKQISNPNFERLHQYACNPENFWPQLRNKVDDFQSTIEHIKNSDELFWVENVEFISDKPGKNDDIKGLGGGGITTDKLIELVKNSKHSIDIQSPYLITTELSQNVFREAVNRGVKIRILTNSLASTDNIEAFSSYQSDRNKLLSTGVEIYEFKPDAAVRKKVMTEELQAVLNYTPIFGLHAKTMVIDNEISVIGTFNVDPRSANLNTECLTIIKSKEVAANVMRGVEEEFKAENAWRITKDFNPDSKVSRKKRIKTWTRKILPKEIL